MRIKQKFSNYEPIYQLDKKGTKLIYIESNDLQKKINSCKSDSLTDLYNKYMAGEVSLKSADDGKFYDASHMKLDKLQVAEAAHEAVSQVKKRKAQLELLKASKRLDLKLEEELSNVSKKDELSQESASVSPHSEEAA